MKVLILGAGQVGRTAAYHLSREPANEVTIVDTNEDVLRELQDRLDVRTVAGSASYPSVLEAAGIVDTDILVALTSSDEVNMIACEIAHTLYRTPTRIARIRATTSAALWRTGVRVATGFPCLVIVTTSPLSISSERCVFASNTPTVFIILV